MSNDELLGSDESLKEMHRAVGFIPTLSKPSEQLLNLGVSRMHQDRINELQPYLALVENEQDITQFTAPGLLAQLSYGFRKSGEYYALAIREWKNAKNSRKQAEAIASLDGIKDYVFKQKQQGNDVKVTDSVRTAYVQIDPDVKRANELESLYEAMMEQLSTIKMEFLMAISSTKAIAFGRRDSDMISGVSHAVNDRE